MNIIEAVTALSEGRCRSVRHTEGNRTVQFSKDFVLDGNRLEVYQSDILATDWELVDETPQFEKVEVVRYECIACKNVYNHPNTRCCGFAEQVKLTGTYKRPLPKKVKRREEQEFTHGGIVLSKELMHRSLHGVKFYAEWEEEVRG